MNKLDRAEQENNEVITQRERESSYPFMVNDEQLFIDGEFRVVQEDHSVIIGLPSVEGVSEDFGVKGGEYHMEIAL